MGKRQAEELAVGAVADFEAFYAARRPGPCPAGTGPLITAGGSAYPVLPGSPLVTTDGTVGWFCCPRFEPPGVRAAVDRQAANQSRYDSRH